MCGRFARRSTQEVLADWFGVELEDMPWFAPTYNAAPQSTQPIVGWTATPAGAEFALMRWGLVPFWAKDAKFGYTTINARAEEASTKPAIAKPSRSAAAWYPPMRSMSGKRVDKKRPNGPMRLRSPAESPMLSPACGRAGNLRRPSPRDLHHPHHRSQRAYGADPQPDAGDPGAAGLRRWLEPGDPARPPADLLRPYPAEKMPAWQVSDRVGNVRNNDPELLEHFSPPEQLFPA